MGDGMNSAQLDRFNRFFDDHYPGSSPRSRKAIPPVPFAERARASRPLAPRQRAVATVVVGTSALVFIGPELFVANR